MQRKRQEELVLHPRQLTLHKVNIIRLLDQYTENKIARGLHLAATSIDRAKREKKILDMEAIKDRLNTIIDLKGYKVSEEMIDLFVERIIYRRVICGNDEFLWIMNLSGEATDASAKYKIRDYDKEYADSLRDDRNFNIVARMMVSVEVI